MFERLILASWYGKWQWTWIFLPLAWIYAWVVARKRRQYLNGLPQKTAGKRIPVIVVGNITAGGTGKTPVVQALASRISAKGFKVGVVTRGYGGNLEAFPHLITVDDTPERVGDEPAMLAQSLNAPVVVDPDRSRGVDRLAELGVDIVISDDGLQHYRLYRDFEICVIDAARGLGNGQMIPVGPLREPESRLNDVDLILYNGGIDSSSFTLQPLRWVNLLTNESVNLQDFNRTLNGEVNAIAGIGNPQRFFDTLSELGIKSKTFAFPDHHCYQNSDVVGFGGSLLMTQKDAVKIRAFATENMWYLEIKAELSESISNELDIQIKRLMGR